MDVYIDLRERELLWNSGLYTASLSMKSRVHCPCVCSCRFPRGKEEGRVEVDAFATVGHLFAWFSWRAFDWKAPHPAIVIFSLAMLLA